MIIQKFGGTSMGTPEAINHSVIPIIKQAKIEGQSPIVVVSAMSGITNSLLKAADHGLNENLEQANAAINEIRDRHRELIRKSIGDLHIMEQAIIYVNTETERLQRLAEGISAVGEITPRVQDKIMAIGEKLSAYILNCILNGQGHRSEYVDLEKIGTNLSLDNEDAWTQVESAFRERLQLVPAGVTPICTGFFGHTRDGLIQTVGRGYSDFTASIAGATMHADKIENWTDVNGVMTTNPQLVSEARTIPSLSYHEVAELSQNGAKVLHPFCIEPAARAGIPIHVRNTFKPKNHGTMIESTPGADQLPELKSIAYKKGISVITIETPRMLDTHGYMEKISRIFARHKVPIDLISTSAVSVSISVDQKPDRLEALLKDLRELGEVKAGNSYGIISIVGSQLNQDLGTFGKIFSELSTAGIAVRMISMGNQQMNLNLVVDDKDLETGIKLLHNLHINHTSHSSPPAAQTSAPKQP